ncbi:MAG: DUF4252 domain-containing protein [bacterium]
MKNIIRTLMTVAFALALISLSGQTAIDDLYKKYAGKSGFTSINISPEMFSMLSTMDMNDSSEKAKEAQNMIEQLSGLKMLVYEAEEGQTDEAFMKEIRTLSNSSGYTELMSVDEENEVVKFLAKKDDDGKISELLMIVLEESEAVVMSMTGHLDMKSISQISKSLEIEGLENLDELEEK